MPKHTSEFEWLVQARGGNLDCVSGHVLDAQGSENGDKCAWASNSANITLGSHNYAVQPLWSNEAYDATGNGCVLGR